MAELKKRIDTKLQEPAAAAAWQAATGGTPQQCPPIYSFDNPSIHRNNRAYLRALGLMEEGSRKPTEAWLVLPTYSGDLHRTIERVHARVCTQFQAWVDDSSCARTMTTYCHKLLSFFLTQTSTQITHCMWGKPTDRHPATMLELYNKVLALGGEKAPRPYC